jgi:hypothetical protein
MRKTLLTSATLFSFGLMLPAFAQNAAPPTPDQAPPAAGAPDAGTASDAGQGPAGTQTAKPKHHHSIVRHVSDTDGQAWAHQPGSGESGPASAVASNIDQADSRSDIAPHFPQPVSGPNGVPESYLKDAQRALASHHTGLAQQALEMAETRLLDRSTPVGEAGQPDSSPEIQQVSQARLALGHGDVTGASAAIQTALASAPQSTP